MTNEGEERCEAAYGGTAPHPTGATLCNEEFRFLVRLYGVVSIEVPFDGANGCGMIDEPIFVDDNGAVICPSDPDIVAAVNAFAEDRLADLGWDWTDAEGACGTVWIDIERGTYQVEAYKRRVIMQARLMSGSLAPGTSENARK